MGSGAGAGSPRGIRRPLSVPKVDRVYQRAVGRLLGQIAREYREGKVDGIHIVVVRPNQGGMDRYHTGMRDLEVVWSANAMILDTMLEKL